jgi:hypothetical protein
MELWPLALLHEFNGMKGARETYEWSAAWGKPIYLQARLHSRMFGRKYDASCMACIEADARLETRCCGL